MSLITSSNEQKIWNFFKSKGLNDYACAGILGNVYAESGFRPDNLQNTYQKRFGMTDEEYTKAVDNGTYDNFVYDSAGYGIFQFTYWSRKKGLLNYARSTHRSIGDLDMQLEYAWLEFEKSYSKMLNTLKTATSVLQASNAVLLNYEKPADQSTAAQNRRASYGQVYYDKYAKNKEAKPTSPATSTSSSKTKTEYASSFSKSLKGAYKTTANLNMRSGAGTSKKILTTIPKGGKVVCYGYYTSVNGVKWYYVAYKNYVGFVSSKYLSK